MRAVTAILVLAASLLVQPALTGDVHARPLDEVVAAGELRAIAYLDNAPFSWDDNGTAKGIDVEIAKALARELSVKAEIILRMQGEKADDDLRVNVWKGPLTGGGVGDIMMHVPIDREFALRNKEAVLGNAYFQEQVALAIHPELTGDAPTFDTFKSMKVGVKLGTVSDYFLMSYQDGALIENVAHHVKDRDGIEAFTSKSVAALLGTRSNIEALLSAKGVKPVIVRPDTDGIVRRDWIVGMAWKDNSRDLGYALAAALDKIKSSGELEKIFSDHGVTYVAPPLP